MDKKESYRHNLPHFQQPGQAYFVTWTLKDAIPPRALLFYTQELEILKSRIDFHREQKHEKQIVDELTLQYNLTRRKYMKAYDQLLASAGNSPVDLSTPGNLEIMVEALLFWEGKKLVSFAYSIMPNHVHWVLKLQEKDKWEKPVYLQDILQSVKRQTASRINKREGRTGALWQKESFDTTIRDEKHLYYAVEYTLNNPVNAGLVLNRDDWPGNGFFDW